MSDALAIRPSDLPAPSDRQPFAMLPWRDPHGVPPGELSRHIERLEQLCLENPASADLRTCLGMAYAVGFQVYKSMDTLEAATVIDPYNFWAQLKYAELHYRLRALTRAQEETRKALDLARNPLQLAIARKQLQEIRLLLHQSARNVEWTQSLKVPTLVLSAMLVAVFVVMMWR